MPSYKTNIRIMYLFKFLISLHFFGGVLIPFFLEWGQLDFKQVMFLQTVFVFAVFLFEIPTGAVADHFGRKTSIILAAAATGMGMGIYSIFQGFYWFLLGEIIWAMGFALLSGADQALVYDSLKKIKEEGRSKKVLGTLSSFHIIGIMVAAPLGSIIAAHISLRAVMVFMIFPQLAGIIAALFLKEPKTEKKIESTRYLNTLIEGVKHFKNHKILRVLAADSISISALVFFLIWMYQPLLIQLNIPILYFGFVHALLSGIQIIFMNNFPTLEKIFRSKKNYLLWSALISGAAFMGLGLNFSALIVIPLILIISGFGFSRRILFEHYMHKHIESENRSTTMSTISMLQKFLSGLLYPIVGYLAEWNLNYSFIIIGAVMVVLAVISKVEEDHLID